MRDDHRRRGKTFEDPELVQAAVNLWLNQMGFESHAQAAAVLGGVHRSAVWRWRNRKSRPDTTALRRMIRLSLWQAEGGARPGFDQSPGRTCPSSSSRGASSLTRSL